MSFPLRSEVAGVDLGDERLNIRLGSLIERLGNSPTLSIPAATSHRAEMEAAYRFFDNSKVTSEKILSSHFKATKQRIGETDFALLVQDTTELDLTRPNQQVSGAGPLDSEARRGAFFHPLHGFDLNGLPLGTAWQKTWTREKLNTDLSKKERSLKRFKTPIEDKESLRWIEGLRAARETAKACPDTTCVCVGDSESDIYEMFAEPRKFQRQDGSVGQVHLLVRARQPRATSEMGDWIKQIRQSGTKRYDDTISVSKRGEQKIVPKMARKRQSSRDARISKVKVRTLAVTLRAPYRLDRKLENVGINLVLIEEAQPPKDCEPISWLLATTLPIDEQGQVQRIVQSYCIRWQIEIFFRTLKSGCRVEERHFEKLSRTENSVALYTIIAWRVMYLCRLGRVCPEMNCDVVFDESEWKAVYTIMNRKDPPTKPPSLNSIIRLIAGLGGYVDRRKTNPGPQTLWIGLQRVHDLSNAWTAFGPDS